MRNEYKYFGDIPVACFYCGKQILKDDVAQNDGRYVCRRCQVKMRYVPAKKAV